MIRGYFAIGIYQPKTSENVGTLWRSALILGASYIFTIGRRYKKQCSDTTKAWRHIPLMEFQNWGDFTAHLPHDAQLIAIENSTFAKPIKHFCHPERAIYLLGSEDNGLPHFALSAAQQTIILPGKYCLNVSVSGSLVMFDRNQKQ